ncbi:DUF6273 domain-containing protein [uncultured Ruminococcus sp.]|uniref:DUF6273 domain-containing protein n=1 Tax=uncultured Ruminococcus sp. TaxID=165186 RepID=UPI00292DB942|nr:DUF6273 domain-containing protein [uncultured Ruminococcus sp.]
MTEREKVLKFCENLSATEIPKVHNFIMGLWANRPVKIFTTVETESNWAALKEAATRGALKSGDKIPVTLKSGEQITLTIGHDERGNAYFSFEDCLKEQRPVNGDGTVTGGWKSFDIRQWLNNELFALLPDDLQAVIEPTEIVQIIDGERVVTKDKLFLFSKTQLFGKGDWSRIEPEDTQIDIFATEKRRVKECGDHGTWPYSTRTPQEYGTNGVAYVGSSGYAGSSIASNSRGVAPGFRITKS